MGTDENARFSISTAYASEIEEWDKQGRPDGETFVLGVTGDVLQGLGAIESDIYMLGDKIKEILSVHPEMTVEEIKKIPQILEDPVLILKSKKEGKINTRLVIFGNVKAQDGRPILSVLDLRPVESNLVVDDMQKVSSAYTKDAKPVEFVKNSLVVYVDKKRATKLLKSIGFKMPIELQQSGFIGSISYYKRSVNIFGESFSKIFKEADTKKFSLQKENSSNALEKKVETEYNKNTSYLLKNWRTDLNATQFKQVETWLRQIDNHEPKRIADTDACWYNGRINGDDLFVIYSTATASNPTILYERKGEKGKLELDILMRTAEVIESGRSAVEKQRTFNEILSGDWVQEEHNMAHNNDRLGGRNGHTGNASVLQGKSSKFIGSRAFRNVLEDILKKSEQNGRVNNVESHSLKGGISATELLDTIEGVQNGKVDAKRRLAKYAEDGIVSTEQYTKLVEKYGAIPKGEKPHRDVQVPKKTADNKKVSQTVRTILEVKATPDEALPTIEKMVEDGIFSYEAYSDKKAIKDAEKHLKGNGWTQSFTEWMRDVERGIVSKQHTAMGWALYNNAVNTAAEATSETERKTAMETALSVLDGMVRHQRSAAQALQATRILKSLSPKTQLYGVQKSVQAFQKELIDKYKDKAPKLKIDEKLAEQFLKAKTEDERLEAETEIYKDIGRQMPSTLADKWNAWRYVAMLANMRTHGRNILGNAFFAPVVLTKALIATGIESVVASSYAKHGKTMLRGKAIVFGSETDKALLKAAWDDYANVADIVSGEEK